MARVPMYVTYIYMVHMSTYMVRVYFMDMCIHIHTLTIIFKEKSGIDLGKQGRNQGEETWQELETERERKGKAM